MIVTNTQKFGIKGLKWKTISDNVSIGMKGEDGINILSNCAILLKNEEGNEEKKKGILNDILKGNYYGTFILCNFNTNELIARGVLYYAYNGDGTYVITDDPQNMKTCIFPNDGVYKGSLMDFTKGSFYLPQLEVDKTKVKDEDIDLIMQKRTNDNLTIERTLDKISSEETKKIDNDPEALLNNMLNSRENGFNQGPQPNFDFNAFNISMNANMNGNVNANKVTDSDLERLLNSRKII